MSQKLGAILDAFAEMNEMNVRQWQVGKTLTVTKHYK